MIKITPNNMIITGTTTYTMPATRNAVATMNLTNGTFTISGAAEELNPNEHLGSALKKIYALMLTSYIDHYEIPVSLIQAFSKIIFGIVIKEKDILREINKIYKQSKNTYYFKFYERITVEFTESKIKLSINNLISIVIETINYNEKLFKIISKNSINNTEMFIDCATVWYPPYNGYPRHIMNIADVLFVNMITEK